jgi:DUF4097 and DUF4098 domain-containing protein YvlB
MEWTIGKSINHRTIGVVLAGLTAGCLMTGCLVTTGCSSPPIGASRTVELGGALPPNPTLIVQSDNGGIHAEGKAPQLRIVATITGRGWSDQEAQGLVDQVGINLKTSGQTVTVEAHKPPGDLANTISIAYEIAVPNPCGLDLVSHNGDVTLRATQGSVHAESHNGRIEADACDGPIVAKSHNGELVIRQFTGNLEATTNNGSVTLVQAPQASPAARVQAVSHNGEIRLKSAPGLSARVSLRTNNGSIHTSRPITVEGKIDRSRVTGTIGTGAGELILETNNGSITLE